MATKVEPTPTLTGDDADRFKKSKKNFWTNWI